MLIKEDLTPDDVSALLALFSRRTAHHVGVDLVGFEFGLLGLWVPTRHVGEAGTRVSTRRDTEVTATVLDELRRYRKEAAQSSESKLSSYPALVGLSGHQDVFDAYHWLVGTLRAFDHRDKELHAAVLATFGQGKTVLERLEDAAENVVEGGADQRSARRWADAGMEKLATALVDQSYMTGKNGIHLIDIGYASTDRTDCLLMMLKWQTFKSSLRGDEYVQARLSDRNLVSWDEPAIWQTKFAPDWVGSGDDVVARFQMELPIFPSDLTLEFYFHTLAPPFVKQYGAPIWNGYTIAVTAHRQLVSLQWLNHRSHLVKLAEFGYDSDELLATRAIFESLGVLEGPESSGSSANTS